MEDLSSALSIVENEFDEELIFKPKSIEELMSEDLFIALFRIKDTKERRQKMIDLEIFARQHSVYKQFTDKLKVYQERYNQEILQIGSNSVSMANITENIDTLKTGKYLCTEEGVKVQKGINMFGVGDSETYICKHPIFPIEQLQNIETGNLKTKLTFYKNQKWNNIVVDNETISNKNKIVMLSNRGISVTSESSKDLVSYLNEILDLNTQTIPLLKSTERLGWTDYGFAPYVEDLKYDGDLAYKSAFEAVTSKGDYDLWKQKMRELRKDSKILHILLASSFASPLNKITDTLPYIVHLFGGTEAGKTVGLMCAMSIWGNPTMGKLVRSLNATQVGMIRYASFLHDLPFAGDELQTIKTNYDNYDNIVMQLTEGIDRSRGTAAGGIENLKSWNCTFLFTGEDPITKSNSGGGVKNRVIEIEAVNKVIQNGNEVVSFIKENYGYAGKDFLDNLPDKEKIKELYNQFFNELKKYTTDKQAMAVANILVADKLSSEIVFSDDPLSIEDIKPYLAQPQEVDVVERAYAWTLNWIAINENMFKENEVGQVWGKFDDDYCLVNRNIYEAALSDNGFDIGAILNKFAERDYIVRNSQGKYSHQTRVKGIKANYIKICLTPLEMEQTSLNTEINDDFPF